MTLEDKLSDFSSCNVFLSDVDQDPKVDDDLRDLIEEVIREGSSLRFRE